MFMKEGEWYPHHIRSWMKYKDHPNVHFVFYEDMKQVSWRLTVGEHLQNLNANQRVKRFVSRAS